MESPSSSTLDPIYTVGPMSTGDVLLVVYGDGATIKIAMNKPAVKTFIKMLEAALPTSDQ